MKGFDYSSDGYYFVTICTEDKISVFGQITEGKMILNTFGEIVINSWLWLPQQYEYVFLDEFTLMPNHFHGILIIRNERNGRDRSLPVKPLSQLIGAFKTVSSKAIHNAGKSDFRWQKSFHDHIIRDEKGLFRIRKYIQNNALKWQFDSENNNEITASAKKEFWEQFLTIDHSMGESPC